MDDWLAGDPAPEPNHSELVVGSRFRSMVMAVYACPIQRYDRAAPDRVTEACGRPGAQRPHLRDAQNSGFGWKNRYRLLVSAKAADSEELHVRIRIPQACFRNRPGPCGWSEGRLLRGDP